MRRRSLTLNLGAVHVGTVGRSGSWSSNTTCICFVCCCLKDFLSLCCVVELQYQQIAAVAVIVCTDALMWQKSGVVVLQRHDALSLHLLHGSSASRHLQSLLTQAHTVLQRASTLCQNQRCALLRPSGRGSGSGWLATDADARN